MCGSFIIGSFFLIAGITVFVNIIFGIHIPFGRIFWGLMLVYIGVMLVTGTTYRFRSCGSRYHGSAASYANWMGAATIDFDVETASKSINQSEFNTVMGSTDLDLTRITPSSVPTNHIPLDININTVFGKTLVKISKDTPVRIDVRGAFSGSQLPNNSSIAFGSHTYISHPDVQFIPVRIVTSTVFGALEIVRV